MNSTNVFVMGSIRTSGLRGRPHEKGAIGLIRIFRATLLLTGAVNLDAAVIYDSGGFESPRFNAAQNLAGQDPVPPPVGFGPWRKDNGTSIAVVQTDIPDGGLQSIKVTRVAGSSGDTRCGINVPITPAPGSNVVAIDFDM